MGVYNARATITPAHIYEHWVWEISLSGPLDGWYFKTYTYINTSINRACLWLLSARATAATFSNFWIKGISSNLHQPKDQYKAGKYLVYILIGPAKNLKKKLGTNIHLLYSSNFVLAHFLLWGYYLTCDMGMCPLF